jgi:16S rRNA (uracil1498-N3)-methyltransferase
MKLFIGEIFSDKVSLREEEIHHIIKVLRMNSGEEIFVTDGRGNLAKGKLLLTGKKAEVEVLKIFPQEQQREKRLHIAIAPTKNVDRFEFFVEKAVELGVSEITPLLCANSERKILNVEKTQKQIESACKQSLRTLFPVINPLIPVKEFMEQKFEKLLITHCYKEFNKVSLQEFFPGRGKITVLVGPEGDFSKKEVENFYSLGAEGVSLGDNRLRTETAGIFIAAGYYYSALN